MHTHLWNGHVPEAGIITSCPVIFRQHLLHLQRLIISAFNMSIQSYFTVLVPGNKVYIILSLLINAALPIAICRPTIDSQPFVQVLHKNDGFVLLQAVM